MHLSEGVLQLPTLLVGAGFALLGVALGVRQLTSERLSLVALFAAAFFVASTIHIPIGIGSVHLILHGIAGLFLGWAVFPAFLIALILQALLFSFGGFGVLGVNLCIMGYPALLAHLLFQRFLTPQKSQLWLCGIGSVLVAMLGSAGLAALFLTWDGSQIYRELIGLLLVSHLPVFVVDSVISVAMLFSLAKMYPEALQRRNG